VKLKLFKIDKAQPSENWREKNRKQLCKPIGQFEEQEEDGYRWFRIETGLENSPIPVYGRFNKETKRTRDERERERERD
jgi:hypothetical protein